MGDNIFDIDVDFEDLGDDQPISDILSKSRKKLHHSSSIKPKKVSSSLINKNNSLNLTDKTDLSLRKSISKESQFLHKSQLAKVGAEQSKNSPKLVKDSDFYNKPKRRHKKQELKKVNKSIITIDEPIDKLNNYDSEIQHHNSSSVNVKKLNVVEKYVDPLAEDEHQEPKIINLSSDEPKEESGYSYGQLNHLCNLVRQDILDMLYRAGSGHSAGSLDQVEIFVALYFKIMRHDPSDFAWKERDILVQSNGHTVPVRYAVMARAGYLSRFELLTLRKFNSNLQGHPERMKIPALETTSGPLGSGLSQACGMALSLMMDKNITRRIYCTMGDGELNEGNIWEAAMLAAKYRLGNIIAIVDRNNIQIDGMAEDVMPMENLREKWESFGWYVQEVDGNNIESVCSALNLAKSQTAKPNLIIAHTIPGKGVDFMEYDYHWHGKAPDKNQEQDAIKKLRTLDGKIEGGNL